MQPRSQGPLLLGPRCETEDPKHEVGTRADKTLRPSALKITIAHLFSTKNTFLGSCSLPLGLEDKRITNGLLSASTYYNAHLAPWHGRLNHRWSWSARTNNLNQWLQVSFVVVVKVTGIATQGRQDYNQWVTQYIVSYSPDSTNFRFYQEGRSTKVRVILSIFNLFRVIFTLIKNCNSNYNITKTHPYERKKRITRCRERKNN